MESSVLKFIMILNFLCKWTMQMPIVEINEYTNKGWREERTERKKQLNDEKLNEDKRKKGKKREKR